MLCCWPGMCTEVFVGALYICGIRDFRKKFMLGYQTKVIVNLINGCSFVHYLSVHGNIMYSVYNVKKFVVIITLSSFGWYNWFHIYLLRKWFILVDV